MPKVFTSKSQKIGKLGEDIACKFLMKHGFTLVERNVTKKWGEIDIVVEKAGRIHFIEVKSVSYDFLLGNDVSREKGRFRPEENMSPLKVKKFRRAIETYLMSVTRETQKPWQVDLLCVYLDQENRKAKVKAINNIIL